MAAAVAAAVVSTREIVHCAAARSAAASCSSSGKSSVSASAINSRPDQRKQKAFAPSCLSSSFAGQQLAARAASSPLRPRQPFASVTTCAVQQTENMQAESMQVSTNGQKESPLQVTYLENNGWIWEVGGVRILVDPWLEDALDFGIPWFYKAFKKKLGSYGIKDLPKVDLILLTQSLDDHAHMKTLVPLSQARPDLPVLTVPSAVQKLKKTSFRNVRAIPIGEEVRLTDSLTIRATTGALVGPPWQKQENGYVITTTTPEPFTMYYEPHCMYDESELKDTRVDVVITPIVSQELPFYTLVAGGEKAARLTKLLGAKYVVPCFNADMEASGILDVVVNSKGDADKFPQYLRDAGSNARIVRPEPGEPFKLPLRE